ncbi:uncharacterized protein LOC107851682 [Capsicum annuum]|uniref:uncharacterized protein LOC107851682 n=1 Tax=Capsicum annuum TaxID=4072 RepID=UPI001FB1376B|nr:uncharacterized protein LOC107851682 [Capsicum annuum]
MAGKNVTTLQLVHCFLHITGEKTTSSLPLFLLRTIAAPQLHRRKPNDQQLLAAAAADLSSPEINGSSRTHSQMEPDYSSIYQRNIDNRMVEAENEDADDEL